MVDCRGKVLQRGGRLRHIAIRQPDENDTRNSRRPFQMGELFAEAHAVVLASHLGVPRYVNLTRFASRDHFSQAGFPAERSWRSAIHAAATARPLAGLSTTRINWLAWSL